MKPKKNPDKDLENFRPLFFKVGLLVALILVFALMEWSSSATASSEKFLVVDADFEMEYLPPNIVNNPEIPKPRKQEYQIFELQCIEGEEYEPIDNGMETNDAIVFNLLEKEEKTEKEPLLFAPIGSSFPGGYKNLMKFIKRNIKYPPWAQENDIEGKVFVRFTINEKGKVSNAHVIRSVDSLLDNEALRIINLLPDWKPAMQAGKPVSVRFTIPVTFKIQ